MSFSATCQVDTTVSGSAATTAITPQSSASYGGVTFTFDRAMPVGTFVTGKPFVVADQAFNITSITPASSSLSGDGVGHGAMKDPYFNGATEQGFDEYIGSSAGTATTQAVIPYNSALNIDPAINGAINIAQGEETTICKSLRSGTSTKGDWDTLADVVPLTVLAVAPPANSFTPTMSGTTKHIYSLADLDWSVLRSVAINAFADTPAQLLADSPPQTGHFGAGGETMRRTRMDRVAGHGLSSTNYSAQIAPHYGKALMVLHSNAYSQAQKTDLFYRIIEWGIQLEGLNDRGWQGFGGYKGGAGQSFALTHIMYFAAFAVQSASMLTKIQAMNSPYDNCRWITSDRVNTVPGSQSGSRGVIFMDEHADTPFCFPDTDVGAQFEGRYALIAASAMLWEAAPVLLLQNGPGGETGFSARNQGAFASTNDKSAVWAMCDRTVTIDPWPGIGDNPGAAGIAIWDTDARDAGVYTPWTGQPEGIYQGSRSSFFGDNGDFFTATSGGFSWNFSAYDYATEAKTGRRFEYSLDGTQFIQDETVGDNDSISGLLPSTTHYLGFQWQSASGWGPRVPNYRTMTTALTSVDPNILATAGSGTPAIPAFTTNPVIHTILRPAFGDLPGNWIPVSGPLGVDLVELKAGQGYVDGADDPTFTYQWKRDGSASGMPTTQTYTRVVADAGADLTCEVTPSNGAGTGSAVASAAVTCPAVQSPPAGTLIDTEFRGAFAIDYATELASASGSNYTITHEASAVPISQDENFGALKFAKTAGNPSGTFDISRAAAATTTYDITAQFVIEGDTISDRGNFWLEVRDGTAAVLFTGQVLGADVLAGEGNDLKVDISDTFTTGANTSLQIRVRWNNGTGGTAGGDPHLSQLRISET